MRTTFLLTATLLFLALSACDSGGSTSKSMQQDFDKQRLDHMLIIDGLVREYHAKTGRYPLDDTPSQIAVAVCIQSAAQQEGHKDNIPIYLEMSTRKQDGQLPPKPDSLQSPDVGDFLTVLSAGLGREVQIPTDPQIVPVNKPCVYLYTYYLGVYDVTVFLHNPFPFAKPLDKFNHKLAVGNRSDPDNALWTAEELTQREDFRTFFIAPFNQGGYTLQSKI